MSTNHSKPHVAKKNLHTVKMLFPYLKPYLGYIVVSILCSLVYVAGTLYIPVLCGDAVDLIVGPSQVDFEGLRQILLRFGITLLAAALGQWVMTLCNNRLTYSMINDIRQDAIRKIEILPLSYLDTKAGGDLVSRVIADVDQLGEGLLMGFSQFFTGIITILGTLCFMVVIHPLVALVVVGITPLSLFVASFIAKNTHHMFGKQSELRGEQTTLVDEMIGNQKIVQIFHHEAKAMEAFDEINEELSNTSLKAVFFSSLTNPSTRFVNSMVYAGVGIFGALFCIATLKGEPMGLIAGGMTIGQLSAFLGYANQYTKPFNEITGVITELQNAFVCADRILELIHEPGETPDAADALALSAENIGSVELRDVSFSYVPEQKLLEHVNLYVEEGKRIAIVGPTGCGKTTLINLLMRFYDVREGEILMDGNDLREIQRKSLRSSYGMVLQETWIKTGTVRENIALGRLEATEEEIIAAAKAAHAHSFIKRLPQGYDTLISDDHDSLSQGQKQLLCIARVMLLSPPLLILDEATSSIDTRTEIRIQKAFHKLMEGRTSFIVAHRLSTIREADCILVMKDGNIIEQGNHEALLKQKGFYAELYRAGTGASS